MGIDFNTMCVVFILVQTSTDDKTLFCHYNRPKNVSDEDLTAEAKDNFEDMKKKGIYKITELTAIYIARSEEQYNYITSDDVKLP